MSRLCDLALRQEAASYRWLAARLPQPARWLVTPLSRTRATAAAVFGAGYPDAPLEVEPDFIEQRLGELEGLPHEVFVERLRHPPHPFWSIHAEERPPGGESFADVVARVGPALERLVEENPAATWWSWRMAARSAPPSPMRWASAARPCWPSRSRIFRSPASRRSARIGASRP